VTAMRVQKLMVWLPTFHSACRDVATGLGVNRVLRSPFLSLIRPASTTVAPA
jgi:hypothetical protein